jgi:hypothetical protein
VTSLTLRTLGVADAAALRRLAERDSAAVPTGTILAAEVEGELVAAISLESGRVVADPFRPTAQIVELLRVSRAETRRPRRSARRAGPLRLRWLPGT